MKKKGNAKKFNEILGLCFFLIGVFTLASLAFHHPGDHPFYTSHPNRPILNSTGLIGAYLSHYSLLSFGYSSYLISLMAIFWAICHFLQKVPHKKFLKWFGFLFFLVASSGLFALSVEGSAKTLHGGLAGYVLDLYLERYFGPLGACILLVAFLLLSLLLATDFFLFPLLSAVYRGTKKFITRTFEFASWTFESTWDALAWLGTKFFAPAASPRRNRMEKRIKGEAHEIEKSFFDEAIAVKVKKYEPTLIVPKGADLRPKASSAHALKERAKDPILVPVPHEALEKEIISIPKEEPAPKDYALPPVTLLNVPPADRKASDEDLKAKSRLLEATLLDFDIEARVVEIEQGPTITRYELMPAPGVKVSSIVSLSDDLALALKAASIRIIAPIPGKSAVGIEVPNSIVDIVYLRELVESPAFESSSYRLPLTLGKDTSGKTLLADLREMPHLLIAGTTGSGKTVCVNSIIAGLLYSRRPDELKLVLIDPKMVELAVYNSIPHMLTPVVTDLKKAAAALNWVVNEMENRYRLLAACTVRNIQAFNSRPKGEVNPDIPETLPYIVVIIDELADLMLVAQDKVETAIMRLSQLSRAVGIHLVLATQRPSVDVITGVIKANFPARISFKVASKVDSRTVLDANGADKLLGKGDMLFLEPGNAKPVRGQASLVTDQEISEIVKFVSDQTKAEYRIDLEKVISTEHVGGTSEKDELYEQAVKVVLESRQASTSILQRRLRLGYGRAARILDMMEQEGVVGPPQGTKAREVLIERLEDAS